MIRLCLFPLALTQDIIQKFVKQRDDWWSVGGVEGAKDESSGPIDALSSLPLPAYFWLLSSTVLAIAFIGSIFQLFYNIPPAPVLGVPITTAVLSASGPAFVFFFVTAISRGQKEADEDDRKYG